MTTFFDHAQGAVAALFLSYFRRAPEFEAMQHYVGVWNAVREPGATPAEALSGLAVQLYEDGVAHGEIPAGPGVSSAWYVEYLYRSMLGREPDAAGQAYWVAALDAGEISLPELAGVVMQAAWQDGGRDAAYLAHRVEVAVAFARWENSNPQVLPNLRHNAVEVLWGVDENPDTMQLALGRLHEQQGQQGASFFLTLGIDILQGTSLNDVFQAVYDGLDGASTLTPFDRVAGGLGHDVLNIYLSKVAAPHRFPAYASVDQIEVVNLYNGAASFLPEEESPWDGIEDFWLTNLHHYQGVQEFWQWHSTAPVVEVPDDVVVGFREVEDLWEDVFLRSGVKSAHLQVEDVGLAAQEAREVAVGPPWLYVVGDALEAVTVEGTLAPGVATLWLDLRLGQGIDTAYLNTALPTDLTVIPWLRGERVAQVDASASRGDLWFVAEEAVLAELEAGFTLQFGSGDDTVVFLDRLPGLRDYLDGGAGYDTLELWTQGRLQTQLYDALDLTMNFEALDLVTDEEIVVDAARLRDFTGLGVGGSGQVTMANLGAEQTLTVFQVPEIDPLGRMRLVLEDAGSDLRLELQDVDLSVSLATVPDVLGNGMLQAWGQGVLDISNRAGHFGSFDFSKLTGGVMLEGMSGQVAETVVLATAGEQDQWVVLGMSLSGHVGAPDAIAVSSTVGRTDTIIGFHEQTVIEVAVQHAGDQARVYQAAFEAGITFAETLAAAALQFDNSGAEAPQAGRDLLAFLFEGDTYLYGDTGGVGSGLYGADDFLLRLTGWNNLDWLVHEAVEFVTAPSA